MPENKKIQQGDDILAKLVKKAELPTFFADYVESRITGEEIILTFCMRNYDNPVKEAIPLVRVYLTIPHYLRFAKMTEENVRKIIKLGIIREEEKLDASGSSKDIDGKQ